jgi:hypothetical protein
MGSLGFEPRLPTPQAGILDHSRCVGTKIHTFETNIPIALARLRPRQPTKHEDLIINTLLKATNSGKSKNTIRSISYSLRQLDKNADLKNPEDVKTYLANAKICNATKTKLCFAYNWLCKTNGIQWSKPTYKWERRIPLIPTTENINKIISASNKKYPTIFTMLAETGLEAQELVTTQRKARALLSKLSCLVVQFQLLSVDVRGIKCTPAPFEVSG